MRRLEVWLRFGIADDGAAAVPRRVGTLAESGADIVFEYDAAFLAEPLPISPINLPVRPGLFRHAERDFDRLPGVFADALPDGFGRLLQDRAFETQGRSRMGLTPLDRLAALGDAAMGALTFRPAVALTSDVGEDETRWELDLAALAAQGARLLEGSAEEVLPQLLATGGSPGGARPKVLAGVSRDGRVIAGTSAAMAMGHRAALGAGFTPYLIKFAAREDIAAFGVDAGAVEFAYWQMARAAGVEVPPARLFRATNGTSWFGVERFDRHGAGGVGRWHLHTLGGLLHASHRQPSLDYDALLMATTSLTRDMRQVEQAVRRMAFNVFAYNRDDHSRNVAYLMNAQGAWRLAPAYDLTFSAGMGGHHSTAIGGETRHPSTGTMMRLAEHAGIVARRAAAVIEEVEAAVMTWKDIARMLDIDGATIARVGAVLSETRAATRRAPVSRRPRGSAR